MKPDKAYAMKCDGVIVYPSIHCFKRDTMAWAREQIAFRDQDNLWKYPVKTLRKYKYELVRIEINEIPN